MRASLRFGSPVVWQQFGKSQVASFLATLLDLTVLLVLTEQLGVWYVASTAWGALAGGLANFALARTWCFEATERPVVGQAFRYSLVSGGSLLWSSMGVWALTEGIQLPYPVSKLGVTLALAVTWNFPLQKAFVFRR